MKKSDKDKKHVRLRLADLGDDNVPSNSGDCSDRDLERQRHKHRDRKSSTTHDGDGSEMF